MVAAPVKEINSQVIQIVNDLQVTLMEKDGIGLAANQIGEPIAIFAINPPACNIDRPPTCIINPEIVSKEGQIENEEGCLSFPDIYEVISRPQFVRITGINPEGKTIQLDATGLLARAIIHEIDHLQGVLFIDHLSELRLKLLAQRLKAIEEMEHRFCD